MITIRKIKNCISQF